MAEILKSSLAMNCEAQNRALLIWKSLAEEA